MDRESLFRLAQQASQSITEYAEKIARQSQVAEKLRLAGESDEFLRAQKVLEELIDEQCGHEAELIRVQTRLMFSDPPA